MTPDDQNEIRAILQGEIAASEKRVAAAVQTIVQTTVQDIVQTAVQASEDRSTERTRDMQSEILRGLEAFARGNFSRLHRLETSDTDLNIRIAALEERVLYLETRRPPQ